MDGGVIAYPTESCYGIGCDPRRHASVRRLLRLKHRPRSLGLIIIGAHLEQLHPYIDLSSSAIIDHVTETWPGPYTWLVPARPGVSQWVRGEHTTVAVRITAHPGASAVCRHARRAIVSTSANRHNRSPARSALGVRREFGDQLDYVLEGQLGRQANPTEIRDAITNRIVRSG
jgi:L-threonylcarbamoyladenylate synthase